ncbi:MAG: hypothetical protein M5U10_00350 [Candidatus Methanoperedens sp.]|nr:hypothetical protein [Candidatus Methanoperedens sp.]
MIINIDIFQRITALILLIPIIAAIMYKVFRLKSLKEEIKENVNRIEEEKRQYGPSWGQILFFLFLIFIGIFNIFLPESPGDDKGFKFVIVGMTIFILWLWYRIPIFIFRKDSLQIESSLFHFFHIYRRKTIRYEDILSAKIEKVKGSPFALYTLFVFTKSDKKRYPLNFNDNITAKIYQCFEKKINDRIKPL